MLLLQQMAVLFFLMVLGYCMRKREILSAETAKFLSWLVVHVANPALILSGSIERDTTLYLALVIHVRAYAAYQCLFQLLLIHLQFPGLVNA